LCCLVCSPACGCLACVIFMQHVVALFVHVLVQVRSPTSSANTLLPTRSAVESWCLFCILLLADHKTHRAKRLNCRKTTRTRPSSCSTLPSPNSCARVLPASIRTSGCWRGSSTPSPSSPRFVVCWAWLRICLEMVCLFLHSILFLLSLHSTCLICKQDEWKTMPWEDTYTNAALHKEFMAGTEKIYAEKARAISLWWFDYLRCVSVCTTRLTTIIGGTIAVAVEATGQQLHGLTVRESGLPHLLAG
jgi:hypothetical protein